MHPVWRWVGSLLAERDRWPLWLPVVFAAGIGVYFALPVEPPAWIARAALAALAGLAVAAWRGGRVPAAAVLLGLALAAGGFARAQWEAERAAAPMLSREIGPATVDGRLVAVDRLEEGARLLIADPVIERLPAAGTPRLVRVRLRDADAVPPVGARVALLAVLGPPPEASAPGAYDFRRQAYFDGLGGVGFALGGATVVQPPRSAADGPALWFETLRQHVAARILANMDAPAAAVAVALMTGEQSAIDAGTMQAMRASGLAHLLSISGVHISLVAGMVFFAVRALLALWEGAALARPIKKYAALAALLAAALYTLVVGAPVPAQRSLIMAGAVLAAVVADRVSLGMRLVAAAAFAVLLIAPDSLTGASFQLSFAAVVALVATFETARAPLAAWRAEGSRLRGALIYAGGVALTSVVAGLATLPFSLYHFQQVSFYGVLANMIAVPLTGALVMPACVAAYLLMPFGAEAIAFVVLGWGLDAIVWTARAVAGLPGAMALVPAVPFGTLLAATFGGLWLCLWRRRWRWLGAPAILAAGFAAMLLSRPPDILVSPDAGLIAVRGADGGLLFSTQRAERFTRDVWLRRAGQTAGVTWPKTGVSRDGSLACDAAGCLYRAHGRVVALPRERAALGEDCAIADVVVAPMAVSGCAAPLVVDRFAAARRGAHAIYLDAGGVRVETARARRDARPWSGGRT